ncbi:MAG: DUF512 domain-containing protein [Candidatus Cloacimonetes bacterium]|nr:DUF512 domain-containing protein [Candidatus Cloacimonadota bacterium]
MPLKIKNILENSLSDIAGIEKNNTILSINSHQINDFIDLQFYGADDYLEIELLGDNGIYHVEIEQDWDTLLGIEPIEKPCRTCINDCIFCFIDQMRPDLRKNLYVKDDDPHLSFVYGNFLTLTNLTEKDYQKFFNQKLTPLYISVHTTNPILHKKMLRYKLKNFNIMDKLKYLSDNDISFHTQIVIIPGYNDNTELERTLTDLTNPNLNTLSIGIVPVGLTRYRTVLSDVQRVDKTGAEKILEISSKYPDTFCADEIYLLAEQEIPPDEFYEDYPQLENGIGMLRSFMESWKDLQGEFFQDLKEISLNPVFVTGKLAFPFLESVSSDIKAKTDFQSRAVMIKNNYFGEMVTVAGLLTASDIFSQVTIQENEIICLGSNIFNDNDVTLDNVSKIEFQEHFKDKIIIINEEFDDWDILPSE